jgi:hypothetical protein
MRVPFHQTNQDLPTLCCRSMKSMAASEVSSSTVSMRFFVS